MAIIKKSPQVQFPLRKTIRFSEEQWEELVATSKRLRLSHADLVRIAVDQLLQKKDKEIKKIYEDYSKVQLPSRVSNPPKLYASFSKNVDFPTP